MGPSVSFVLVCLGVFPFFCLFFFTIDYLWTIIETQKSFKKYSFQCRFVLSVKKADLASPNVVHKIKNPSFFVSVSLLFS